MDWWPVQLPRPCPPRSLWSLLFGSAIFLAGGCKIPPLYGPDPGAPLPSTFRGQIQSENSAQLGIDEFFEDQTLVELIGEGLANNQELKIRNQEIEIASYEVWARRGAYLPFVTVGSGGGFERTSRFLPLGAAEDQLTAPGGRRFPDPLPRVGLATNLFWQIDYLRQLRNARDAALQRYCAAIEARDYALTQIVAEIAENYYELAALDQRLVYLNQTIELQRRSLEVARAQKEAARGTELGVQRFLAEVRKNESQRQIIQQRLIEVENRINFLAGRFPQSVERRGWNFIGLDSRVLQVGVPAELLLNRRDIRAAEFEVAAAGLDVLVARANFFPKLGISASVGFEAFNPRYLFDPGSFVASAAGELAAPLINKNAIQAEYQTANAKQLQAIYNYQRTILNAFAEVVNSIAKVENYRQSVAIKLQEVNALEQSVDVATNLFNAAREEVDYVDVLFAQRDLLEARISLIETKQQQLSGIIRAYQALGGGVLLSDDFTGTAGLSDQPQKPRPDEPDMTVPPSPEEDQSTPENGKL